MAYNFSANQFEQQYSSKRLGNWEQPHSYPMRPRPRRGSSKIISDDNGHLLPDLKRAEKSPWGHFRSTYQLPEKITRRFAEEYNKCLNGRIKWKGTPESKPASCEDNNNNSGDLGVSGKGCGTTCDTAARFLKADKNFERLIHPCERPKKGAVDFEYVPGDFTPAPQQHDSRRHLLQQKYERDNGIEPALPLDKLYLGHHDPECRDLKLDVIKDTFSPPLPTTSALGTSVSPATHNLQPYASEFNGGDFGKSAFARSTSAGSGTGAGGTAGGLGFTMPLHSITEKPNERCPSPVVPAFANFDLARRMHMDNLEHQPLPDCVADAAYRRLQMSGSGGGDGGLALDISPIATGVGIRTYNAGPTHCTKMKVYRPKTCGVVPKVYNTDLDGMGGGGGYRGANSAQGGKKMGAMDLAIGWDYRPYDPADEPIRPAHIDGSDETAGPAVFNYVKSPRADEGNALASAGRSAGVFNSTLGEPDFFDKDIMRRKTDFTGRHVETSLDDCAGCTGGGGSASLQVPRARSMSRDHHPDNHLPVGGLRMSNQYRSTPNVMSDQDYKTMREKYLGGSSANCGRVAATGAPACRRGFLRRARPCHKVAPASCCLNLDGMPSSPPSHFARCKPSAFRAGLPKYDAGGNFVSADSGCSMGSTHAHRVLVVPRPKIPYSKKNYDIDTLVPPFRSSAGGAAEGGYPEHWRLASVYQHAYKPPELRRRPLLQTVYK